MSDRKIDQLLLNMGYVTGALESEDLAAQFAAALASDVEGQERVWRWTQRLRDRLTALLIAAGREEAP